MILTRAFALIILVTNHMPEIYGVQLNRWVEGGLDDLLLFGSKVYPEIGCQKRFVIQKVD